MFSLYLQESKKLLFFYVNAGSSHCLYFFDICCWYFMHHVTSLRLLEGVVWGKAGGKFAFSPLVELSDQWGLKTDHWCSRNSDSGRSHRVKLKRFFFFYFCFSRLQTASCDPSAANHDGLSGQTSSLEEKKKKSTDQCSRFFFFFFSFRIRHYYYFFFHLHATRGLTKACVGWSLAHPSPAEEQQSSELMDSDVKKIIKE